MLSVALLLLFLRVASFLGGSDGESILGQEELQE